MIKLLYKLYRKKSKLNNDNNLTSTINNKRLVEGEVGGEELKIDV